MVTTLAPEAAATALDTHLARVGRRRARRGLPAPQVLVRAPGLEYSSGERALPFHAASVGKLATAALVMQEVEAGGLTLSTCVSEILSDVETAGLFAGSGATVGQLVGHTSGVADYFEGPVTAGPRFDRLVASGPEREWTPESLLAFTKERQRPVAPPGKRFRYSDTGYVLLGRILEEVTGRTFTELLRSRVLDPAGMTASALWRREPGPDRIAPLWVHGVELSGAASLSCDWSGGGIVTTLDDLARLATALRDRTLVRPETFAAMTAPRVRFRAGIHYGLGAMQLRFGEFSPFLRSLPRPVGHLGVLGVHCFTDPEREVTVVLNFHSTREMTASFRTHIQIARLLDRVR
ncbi:MAG: beta-lactamase family protein [Actinomycetales bacterium]|nr:beta-lactamase family protein [Actinomycetales bacterium]